MFVVMFIPYISIHFLYFIALTTSIYYIVNLILVTDMVTKPRRLVMTSGRHLHTHDVVIPASIIKLYYANIEYNRS